MADRAKTKVMGGPESAYKTVAMTGEPAQGSVRDGKE
jgi:hypothetical protein